MKKIVYILAGVIVLGVIGNLLNPKKKEVKKDVQTESKIDVVKIDKKSAIELDNAEFWSLYEPKVKERIYILIENKDCKGLQKEFDIADDNSNSQMARTGHNNSDLMNFLDERMRELDCYN